MKQIMITVKPEYLVNILNGYKTLELRTYILKNFDKIVKEQGGIWVNVYCSKSKPYLDQDIGRYFLVRGLDYIGYPVLNDKVVCRFWFDEYSFMEYFNNDFVIDGAYNYNQLFQDGVHPKNMCLTNNELVQYGKGKDLYAWHIKQLEIFDDPKELGEFQNYYRKEKIDYKPLTHAPQKYAYVWGKEE